MQHFPAQRGPFPSHANKNGTGVSAWEALSAQHSQKYRTRHKSAALTPERRIDTRNGTMNLLEDPFVLVFLTVNVLGNLFVFLSSID